MTPVGARTVVLVQWPVYDQYQGIMFKRRPALVVRECRLLYSDLIACPVSSKRKSDSIQFDWQAAGLSVPSFIRPVPMTLPRQSVIKVYGAVSVDEWHSAMAGLAGVMGLGLPPVGP